MLYARKHSSSNLKRPAIDLQTPPPSHPAALTHFSTLRGRTDDPEQADDSGMSDLFVKIKFGRDVVRNTKDWRSTDTHMRALEGKASFNYRFKWDVSLDPKHGIRSEDCRLQVQLWDLDVVSVNDCLGETQLDLHKCVTHTARPAPPRAKPLASRLGPIESHASRHCPVLTSRASSLTPPRRRWYRRFARRTTPKPQYCSAALLSAGAKPGTPQIKPAGATSLFDPAAAGCFRGAEEELNKVDPTVEHARFWLPIVKRPKGETTPRETGKVMVSLQLLPKAQAEKLPAGDAQNEPNTNPHLPPAQGRIGDETFPMQVYRLIGPKWLRYLLCAALLAVGLWALYEFLKSLVVSYTSLALLLPHFATNAIATTPLSSAAAGSAAASASAAAAASAAARQQAAAGQQAVAGNDPYERQVSQQALAIQAMGSDAVRRLADPYVSRALQLAKAEGDGQQSIVGSPQLLAPEAAAVQFCVGRLTDSLETTAALPAGPKVGSSPASSGSPSNLSESHQLVSVPDAEPVAGIHNGAGVAMARAKDNASTAAVPVAVPAGAAAAARVALPAGKASQALPKTEAVQRPRQPLGNGTVGRTRGGGKPKKEGLPSAALVPPVTPNGGDSAANQSLQGNASSD